MDNTFDLGQNYSGWSTTGYQADPCDLSNQFSNTGPNMGHFDIFNALMDNVGFKNMFINRYNTLTQTYFSCNYAIPFLDSMVANIAPEMPAQIARWGGNLNTWQNNVLLMKNQITGRCSVITQGIIDCYGEVNVNTNAEMAINKIVVFPNPSEGQFTISSFSKIKEIKLFDLCGREVIVNPDFVSERKANLTIDSKGVYLVQIYDLNNKVKTQKLIVN
jgi:hypothetical protein